MYYIYCYFIILDITYILLLLFYYYYVYIYILDLLPTSCRSRTNLCLYMFVHIGVAPPCSLSGDLPFVSPFSRFEPRVFEVVVLEPSKQGVASTSTHRKYVAGKQLMRLKAFTLFLESS